MLDALCSCACLISISFFQAPSSPVAAKVFRFARILGLLETGSIAATKPNNDGVGGQEPPDSHPKMHTIVCKMMDGTRWEASQAVAHPPLLLQLLHRHRLGTPATCHVLGSITCIRACLPSADPCAHIRDEHTTSHCPAFNNNLRASKAFIYARNGIKAYVP